MQTSNEDSSDRRLVTDCATQTCLTKNIDVISNVQLSETTLSAIYNEVLQDASKTRVPPHNSKVIQVQQIPTFQLASSKEPKHIMKYVISNVDAGSSYYKLEKRPDVVTRFSALPRTASMEVNTSEDNTVHGSEEDDDDDGNSLVDSLEDPASPRSSKRRSLSSMLPDNSHKSPKSYAFFVPIKGADNLDMKSVAEHLPKTVKDRINSRQLEREEKLRQMKSETSSSRTILPQIVDRRPRKKKTKAGKPRKAAARKPKVESEKPIARSKSRIPIPSRPKLPSISKPNLSFEQPYNSEPKVDQLIANILIDALNKPECFLEPKSKSPSEDSKREGRRKPVARVPKSSLPYKGKVSLEVIRDDNFSTIPKGWITFYTLTKSQESSESSSDEGINLTTICKNLY